MKLALPPLEPGSPPVSLADSFYYRPTEPGSGSYCYAARTSDGERER